MILSASRRTDIPAWFSPWLIRRMEEGEVVVSNSRSPGTFRRIHFTPASIDCLVLWSKNPGPLLGYLDRLDALGYRYYFQFTLNPYGPELEPGLPPLAERIETFRRLSRRLGRQRVLWRYDPVLISPRFSVEYHRQQFRELAEQIAPYTSRCTFSYIDLYRGMQGRTAPFGVGEVCGQDMLNLAQIFAELAAQYELKLSACCEQVDLASFGIGPASCVDAQLAGQLAGGALRVRRDAGQRRACNCCESVDIGMYDSCLHGCRYCYANGGRDTVQKIFYTHNPAAPILLGEVPETALMREIWAESLCTGQTTLQGGNT